MWMRRHSKCDRGRDRGGIGRTAFTLIELLVVVAIIAMLVSILLPSLSAARESARAVVCGQHMRQFGNGLATYTQSNGDWLPGVNTSGAGVWSKLIKYNTDGPECLYQSKMPVQTYDWMTPILADTQELPSVRAERFKFLLERYRCASNFVPSTLYVKPPREGNAFDEQGSWPSVSYLMPAYFQYFGQQDLRQPIFFDGTGGHVPIKRGALEWEVLTQRYVPLLTRVGPPARKLFVTDATRYLESEFLPLDHDVLPFPSNFGSFTDGGGWWSGSTAYGVKSGTQNWSGSNVTQASRSQGQNLALTYRHGRQRGVPSGSARDNTGSINGVFFDGHVERMSDRQSREIQYWYPTGSTVQQTEGMTDLPVGYVIP